MPNYTCDIHFSQTYCVNAQVADSACSATAYLCGVKANLGTIGVTAAVTQGDCIASQNQSNHLESIARLFQKKGRSTGIVTTTKVTDASPAGVYAVTSHRDWESDSDVRNALKDPLECVDIADQLLNSPTGQNLQVILGGGRAKFLPTTYTDVDNIPGNRTDGRNLIDEWSQKKGKHAHFVSDREALTSVPSNTTHLLGLFSSGHMDYNLDRNKTSSPSLTEMTESAIKILSKNRNGYFLFVEGGRIDQAHHDSKARKALDETVEFHKAVQAAVDLTNREDTLIIVTSDHGHTMNINGYPIRGNDILGISGNLAMDGLPYTTLTYSNGPGYSVLESGQRPNISNDDLANKNYAYYSGIPYELETHGGDDVAIFGLGPWAHLFVGVLEQNVIPHILAYAACVGNGITACNKS